MGAIDVRRPIEKPVVPLRWVGEIAVICGVPTGEAVALWRALAVDGATPEVVRRRVLRALVGSRPVPLRGRAPRPRIF
jgi:hypothetical protein